MYQLLRLHSGYYSLQARYVTCFTTSRSRRELLFLSPNSNPPKYGICTATNPGLVRMNPNPKKLYRTLSLARPRKSNHGLSPSKAVFLSNSNDSGYRSLWRSETCYVYRTLSVRGFRHRSSIIIVFHNMGKRAPIYRAGKASALS
jgi:hypothetical protein